MSIAVERLREMRALLSSNSPFDLIPKLKFKPTELVGIAPTDADKAQLLNYFAYDATQRGDLLGAFRDFQKAYDLTGEMRTLANAMIVARRAKNGFPEAQRAEILEAADKAVSGAQDSDQLVEMYDVLCHNCGQWGDLEAAARYGAKSLAIKDRMQSPRFELADRARPTFNFDKPAANVIAFSLFGSKPRYLTVALENARACQYVFPGWSCRFYVDRSVPEAALGQLAAAGCQLQMMPDLHDPKSGSGLFWRFLVASDPNVDFFMVRDADSLISVREKNVVDEWIASDCDFHVIRDFYSHSELILAGLWGGVGGRIADISKLIANYHKQPKGGQIGVHNHDQLFLRTVIWPSVKSSLLQHDSVFHAHGDGDIRDFPSVGTIHPLRHVGQNMGIFMKNNGES